MNPQTVVGSVTGTGANLDIILGFQPDHVRIVNTTDGNAIYEWFRGMTDGTAINDSGAAPATLAAPNGITAIDAANGSGFRIGPTISANGKTLRYFATRSGPGAN